MNPDDLTPGEVDPDDPATMHDLAGAYALDALPSDEEEAFEDHLDRCGDCRAEVASLREVTANLARLSSEPPPADARASVLSAITSIPQDVVTGETTDRVDPRPTPLPTVPPIPTTRPVESAPDVVPVEPGDQGGRTDDRPGALAEVVSLDDHRRLRRSTRFVTGIAAALALVLGGVGLWAGDLRQELRGQDEAISQVAAVLNAPDAQLLSDAGTSLVLSPSQQQAVFAAGTLRAPDSSSVLQVWVIGADGPTSAGLVTDPGEPVALAVPVPPGATVGVTVEPAGGSDQPTSDPVVAFST